jgi:hypothetical protein
MAISLICGETTPQEHKLQKTIFDFSKNEKTNFEKYFFDQPPIRGEFVHEKPRSRADRSQVVPL